MKNKRPLFYCCIVVLCYLFLEAGSFALYSIMYGQWFSFTAIHTRQIAVIRDWDISIDYVRNKQKTDDIVGNRVMHPYLGFVYNIDYPGKNYLVPNVTITKYGLAGDEDPFIAGRDPNNAMVAITGGSVAEFVFAYSRDKLRSILQTLPAFKSKHVVMIMLGQASWKQPQQFLSVAYYLIQGGRLDMLINIDGKNEVTLPYRNVNDGLYPAFPASFQWPTSIPHADDTTITSVLFWKKIRAIPANIFQYVRFSVTASTLWSLLDDYFLRQEVAETKEMTHSQKHTLPYYLSGPDTMHNASPKEVVDFSVLIWEQSTRQLSYLAKANHFYYFHFLQPNQYVPNSKVLTKRELAVAYKKASDENLTVTSMYPSLMARVKALRAEGINAYDLTGIYKNTADTIYIDSCCHVNQMGNDLMAQAIGANIADYFKRN